MIYAARTSWMAFSNWLLLIWAALPQLLSRQTRGSRLIFLATLAEPLILVGVLYAIRGLMKQNTPNYGTSLFLFYASGFMPFYLFIRISSRLRSTDFNLNSLLPRATALDAYIAAAILDALLNITTTILVFYGMWLYGIDEARPASIVDCTLPMLLLIVLGVGVGMINNVITRFAKIWAMIYRIMTRGLLFLSGVIIIVDLTPIWLRDIVVLNPLAHGVDWFRVGVYGDYPHNFLDKSYLCEWALIALFIGFVVDRAALRSEAK